MYHDRLWPTTAITTIPSIKSAVNSFFIGFSVNNSYSGSDYPCIRGDATIAGFSFIALVREVEPQHRLRIPKGLFETITWLQPADAPITALGLLGPFGGMHITPLSGSLHDARQKLRDYLLTKPAVVDDVTTAVLDSARYFAAGWNITITYETARERFAMTLPEEARLLNVVPNEKQIAVIFATGSILEVWPADEWRTYARRIGVTLSATLERAAREMES